MKHDYVAYFDLNNRGVPCDIIMGSDLYPYDNWMECRPSEQRKLDKLVRLQECGRKFTKIERFYSNVWKEEHFPGFNGWSF